MFLNTEKDMDEDEDADANGKEKFNALLQEISGFRARKTIFEQLRNVNKEGNQIMKSKRMVHERIINRRKELKSMEVSALANANAKNMEASVVDTGNDEQKFKTVNDDKEPIENNVPTKIPNKEHSRKKRKPRRGNGAEKSSKKKKREFRDPNFFMSSVPASGGAAEEEQFRVHGNGQRIDDHVLDLDPDDADALKQKRMVHKWDLKKKKYIKVHTDGVMSSGRFNESGKRISKKYVPQLYEKWKQKTHRNIEDASEVPEAKRGRLVTQKQNQQEVKDELKSKAEIRRARQKKERRKSYLAMKGKKKKRKGR